jgi:hypothetical protein
MPYSLDAWRDQMIVGHPARDAITRPGETRVPGDLEWVD